MDAFVKIITQKKIIDNTLHQKEIELLKKYLDDGENVFICGAAGVGKSYVLNAVLDESNSIDIDPINKLHHELADSSAHVFIDDYRHDNTIQRQIVEQVSDGLKISKGSLVVCSSNVLLLPNFKTILIPKRSPDLISTLQAGNPMAVQAAEMCNGNIHNFFDYINRSDKKDVFINPKDFAIIALCTTNPLNSSDAMSEHGHIWGMIHENYVDSSKADITRISASMSDADLHDMNIYKGNWYSMPFFIDTALKIPRLYLNGTLNENTLRPGSFWTKYGNYKMRYQKYRDISMRANGATHQELTLLREYARSGNVDIYTSYNLDAQDFDVINHLALSNKLKPREVSQIKKKIKESTKHNDKPT